MMTPDERSTHRAIVLAFGRLMLTTEENQLRRPCVRHLQTSESKLPRALPAMSLRHSAGGTLLTLAFVALACLRGTPSDDAFVLLSQPAGRRLVVDESDARGIPTLSLVTRAHEGIGAAARSAAHSRERLGARGRRGVEGGADGSTITSTEIQRMKLLEKSLSEIEERISEGAKHAAASKLRSRWSAAKSSWSVPGAEPSQSLPETKKLWEHFALAFRAEHPGLSPVEEQEQADAAWRKEHPEIYYAHFPDEGAAGGGGGAASRGFAGGSHRRGWHYHHHRRHHRDHHHRGYHHHHHRGWGFDHDGASLPHGDKGYAHFPAGGVPATVFGPRGDGVRDWDGRSAVVARLPELGWSSPSKLTEHGLEVRGSFVVRVMDAVGSPSLLVERAQSGDTPFKCTYRGYRHLDGDFKGNTVYTGYKLAWYSHGGRISTGDQIGMSGNPNEFDVMTCRDLGTGEVQYFRLQPEKVLANMKERYCAGYKPIGPYDISCT